MHLKSGGYYHVSSITPRKWTPLGKDINEARRQWAELETEPVAAEDKSFSVIFRRYMVEIFPALSRQTQHDYIVCGALLEGVFGHLPIDSIRPRDIAEYMRVRGESAKVRANREKALLARFSIMLGRGATQTQ
ncbi:MAG: hypothetical protein Q7K26_05905 [bacterium]|nr:hypothetical protein [bacterium]